jgi:hypothetical protein
VLHADDLTPVEKHFLKAIKEVKKLEKGKSKKKKS